MLKLSLSDRNELEVEHYDTSPTVYLDHWALLEFAGDDSASRQCNGGLVGSDPGYVGEEIGRDVRCAFVSDAAQIEPGKILVAAILIPPHGLFRFFLADGEVVLGVHDEDGMGN